MGISSNLWNFVVQMDRSIPHPHHRNRSFVRGTNLLPLKIFRGLVNNESERFLATFDLLGVFLSIIGPAPTTSSEAPPAKISFFPDIVYGRWCITLATGSSKAQVACVRHDNRRSWFFLGANARGWKKRRLAIARKAEASRVYDPYLGIQWREWGTSPSINLDDPRGGRNYGSCARHIPSSTF